MDYEVFFPTDFNPIGVEPGDRVCFGPVKLFMKGFYWGFVLTHGEVEEPFEVVDTFPVFNFTEVSFRGGRMLICNDMLVKFHWN